MNDIHQITILGGHGKNVREPDRVAQIALRMGEIISIVGPTGSGKTTLINDIELFANGDTPTGRRILIDGQPAPASCRNDPGNNPIALITQHTNSSPICGPDGSSKRTPASAAPIPTMSSR